MCTTWLNAPVYALTSGPSQPETQQFAAAGMDNMVDPFTGDFSYNIPLMDVGGYPININYASGITPDQEASWVGLGWNLNVGAINRSVRGLPDDFAGDEVSKEYNTKPNQTFGVTGNVNFEIYGVKLPKGVKGKANIGLSANLYYNTYNGFGMGVGASPSISAGGSAKSRFTGKLGINATVDSEGGATVTPTVGLSAKQGKDNDGGTFNASVGLPFNSREGLKGMSFSGGYTSKERTRGGKTKDGKDASDKVSSSGGSSAFMGFASPTYSPFMEQDMFNINAALDLSFSAPNPAIEPTPFGFGGYYSGQFLKSTSWSHPAYGFMYSGLNTSDGKLLDFNREKDAAFNEFSTNLAVPNHTYDVFQVSGQGIGGTYRLFRGEVGSVSDPIHHDQSYSPKLGLDFGSTGVTSKVGVDLEFNYTQSNSSRWPEDNAYINRFNKENVFGSGLNDPNREAAYFKKLGEPTPESDINFLNNTQNAYNPFRHSIAQGIGGYLDGKYVVEGSVNGKRDIPNVDNQRKVRRPRSTNFTTLTATEANSVGILPIQNYSLNNFNWNSKDQTARTPNSTNTISGYDKTSIARISDNKKGHHISEIRVTDESGSRYVYGIPAYNTLQEEISFAKPRSQSDYGPITTGLIAYSPGSDDASSNKNGLDNYYSKVSTPGFAHSYLLTNILSSDYVDSDNIPGPSDGDFGNYTKFNYSKLTDDFIWRTPFQQNVASFSDGMVGTTSDDKANYIWGKKEIWYLHSIETRTHVAEFYLEDRLDGRGVAGQHGGIGSTKLKSLSKIVLYSKTDKSNTNPEPLKTVYFDYDYSLSPSTPNSEATNQGKLTLKKIWFTYGKSGKGVLNPYKFTYADQNFDGIIDADLNPSFDFKNYDRWGNFQKDNLTNRPTNAEFPYTNQDKSITDRSAAVYALSSIQNPTGNTTRVYYESDDYAYVQNKQANRMFKVLGVTNGNEDISSVLYTNDDLINQNLNDKNYLAVDLEEGFTPDGSSTSVDDQFRQKYLNGIDLMYFKMNTRVIYDPVSEKQRWEYVPGYAEIDASSSRLLTSGQTTSEGVITYKRALIKLKGVDSQSGGDIGNTQISPIVRTGWMYARLNLNREIMGSADSGDNGLIQVLRSLLSSIGGIVRLFTGFSLFMATANHSNRIDPSKSFVRLNEPDKIKLGGGHRVKAIVVVDNWNTMKSKNETTNALPDKQVSLYGQKYNYTFTENGQTISAGVAAYEPVLGGEENPFRQPIFVKEKVPLAPSKEYFLEEPFGESFFPGAVVGYRKVEIIPLKITSATFNVSTVTGNGTGKVVQEFYTAYDFPTITKRTNLDFQRHKPNIILQFMKFDCMDLITAAQGYYIELNDMHGKQKAQRVYAEAQSGSAADPISEVEYFYKTNTNNTLNNTVKYINPNLEVVDGASAAELGVEVDVVQDERFYETITIGGGVQLNIKFTVPFVFTPTGFPDINYEYNRFRSVVTTKVVNRYGILEKTVAKDNGATITTQNLAWDSKTGGVLLQSVQNEFHDPIYSFTYPAYWAYDRMGFVSDNEGMIFDDLSNTTVSGRLRDGDEIYIQNAVSGTVAYFDKENGTLMDKTGLEISTANIGFSKVIRSGARNMHSVPVGSIVTLENPIQSGQTSLQFSKILNAGASEYKDGWKRFCNCASNGLDDLNASSNPFLKWQRGNTRPLRSWAYLTERNQEVTNNNLNIRKDGFFSDFTPFWTYDPTSKFIAPPLTLEGMKWQFVTEIKKYNPAGMEIENQDALKRYSMAQYGYGRNLPVATSNNSRYQESGFDGFEDYGYDDCLDEHLGWRTFSNKLTNVESHTGLKSIKVSRGDVVKINKVIVVCPDDSPTSTSTISGSNP